MPNSEETCSTSGIYSGACTVAHHPNEIVIVEGESFPMCGECGEPVVWKDAGGIVSLRPEGPAR